MTKTAMMALGICALLGAGSRVMAQEPSSAPSPVAPPPEGGAAEAPPGPAEAPAPSPPPTSPHEPPLPAAPVEIVVRGSPTEAQRLVQSAEAVTVLDTRRAKQRSSDLGEIMARTQGVSVRRSGGLGSGERFSLNGLEGAQIRFFLDGVPLELAGYPFGIANVPVNLVERIEIYRGVVPIRFGSDALGGAVHLVTDPHYDTHLSASYQVGSFGTRRATAAGRYRHEPSGFIAGASVFLDVARNDYLVDVEVGTRNPQPTTVRRFHDGYLAYGGSAEVGFLDRPWARRLLLRGFASTFDKELQHNIPMTVPYGEVEYGETVAGATLRYEQPLLENIELDLLATYTHRIIDYLDTSEWVYHWRGRTPRAERGTKPTGEVDGNAHDQTQWQNTALARATVTWRISPEHAARLSVAPTFTKRTGVERILWLEGKRDPLSARRETFALVSGLELESNAFPMPGAPAGDDRDAARDDRLQNVLFLKTYLMKSSSEEELRGGVFRPLARDVLRAGVGDGLRVRLTEWLQLKASYELATRLPSPNELFGDGVLVKPNLHLEPEASHNANLGPRLDLRRTAIGDLTADINGFLRESDRLIALLGNDRLHAFQYQNVNGARALGVEGQLGWASPGRRVSLDGSVTLQDVRNTSSEGAYGMFEGDRLPNRPWLFASFEARARIPRVLVARDDLEPFYLGRYVHEFYRGWESSGDKATKQLVPSQLSHGAGVTYSLRTDVGRVSTTLEVQNLTDARLFDLYGAQRPGRAFSFKVAADI